jgi:hypothetical protein
MVDAERWIGSRQRWLSTTLENWTVATLEK